MTEAADMSIERLYDIMKLIDENKKGGNATENLALFKEIVDSTAKGAGDSRSKRLASQFIARLFKEFPTEQETAYEAMVDLVEDEDVAIRKQVISDLPKLCKDATAFVPKVADLLTQLLQTGDTQEHSLVNQALMQTLTAHPADALTGLFDQLEHDDVADLTRERALRFLEAKLLPHLSLTPEQEELLVRLADRLLDDVTEDEFVCVVRLLRSLGCMRGSAGRQRLVDIVCQQVDLAADAFDPASVAGVARAVECARLAVDTAARGSNAKALLVFYLDKVLPVIDQVPDAPLPESPRLELLRCLAELTCFGGNSFIATDKQLGSLLSLLKSLLPLPPPPPPPDSADADAAAAASKPEEGEIEQPPPAAPSPSSSTPEPPELNFSQLECVLFALHRLGRTNPDFFTACPERLADLVDRLRYFSLTNQIYLRALKSAAAAADTDTKMKADDEAGDDKEKDEAAAAAASAASALRKTALAATENLSRLARDLLRSPPSFGESGVAANSLSWRLHRRLPALSASLDDADEQLPRRRQGRPPPPPLQRKRRDRDRDRYDGGGSWGGRRGWKSQRW